MSRLINSTYITLDGAVENPQNWPSGRHQDDGRAQEIQTNLLLDSETVLMGRRTYEGFAPVWSGKSGDPYSDKINAMEKLVASTTLGDPDWNNTTVVADGLTAEIARRKETGGDIVQYGFGSVTRALLDAGHRVIFLLGDGMGDSEITAARNYYYGAAGHLPGIDALPLTGEATTYALIEHPGFPDNGLPQYVTDSAASGTSWATGHKTSNGRISTTIDEPCGVIASREERVETRFGEATGGGGGRRCDAHRR